MTSQLMTRRRFLPALGSLIVLPIGIPRALARTTGPECHAEEGFQLWGKRPLSLGGYRYNAFTSGSCWSIERGTKEQGRFRFEVQGGDSTLEDVRSKNSSERAEFNQSGTLDQHRIIELDFQMMIEEGPTAKAAWTVLSQFHHTPDLGDEDTSPPLAQYLRPGDEFQIQSRTYPSKPVTRKNAATVHFKQPNFERGRWHRLNYRIRFSPDNDGMLHCTLNGQEVVNYAGGLGYRNQRGPYFKFGIYRAPSDEPIAVQYKDISLRYG